MAMIKEKQRDKCSSVNKKAKNNGSSSVTNNDGTLKTAISENDIEIKDESFGISDDMEKVSNSSPASVTCTFADPKSFKMEMCSVENSCEGMLPPIPMSMAPSGPVDGIQPLPSSVVNKQPSTIDAQFMQQQSQVFVFSTEMANKSADSVMKGIHKSIIQYHCAQPKTRKYLERNPLKMSQHNRQNSNQWLNNFGPMKSKNMGMGPQCNVDRGGFRNNPMMMADALNSGPVGPPPGGMNMTRLPMWNQQGNMNPMNVNANNQHAPMMSMCNNNMMRGGPGPGPMTSPMNAVLPGQMGPNPSGMMHGGMPMKCQSQPSPMDMMSDAANSNPLNVLPPLGVKVPDENLTPEQRLMREDKMATLRRIGEMLLPENQQSPAHRPMNAEMASSAHNAISVDDISSVLGANDSTDMQIQKTGPNGGGAAGGAGPCPGGPNGGGGPPADWQKMPPFFEDRKRAPEVGSRCSSARSQGPPPPYHQTTRSASVPIAVPSPNPNSPGNATSNLSLPSPRTCSGMNSPASKQGPGPSPTTNQLNSSIESPSGQSSHGGRGMNISNPGTPVSSGMHLSPNSKQKDGKMCTGQLPSEFSPAASGQQSPDSIFTRSLQNLARQQQHQKPQPQLPHTQPMQSANSHCKEPNLMPVPSPQHIQYLSTFEGQELTIQKQPNTSLKDTPSIVSPSLSSAGLDSMIPVSTDSSCAKVSVSAPNTPLTPSSLDIATSKYPGTPGDFSALSPSSGGGGPDPAKTQMRGGGPPNSSSQLKNDLRFPCNSPQLGDPSSQMQQQLQQPPQQQQPPPQQQQQQRFQPTTTSYMSSPANKNTFLDVSSPDKLSCGMVGVGAEPKDGGGVSCSTAQFARIMPNNVPIDSTAVPKPPFDPISSLTQMSQQLTNSVPGSPASQVGMMHSGMMYGGGGGGGGGHLPPNSMGMMPMNEMSMCGPPAPEPPPPVSMADGSRMVFSAQQMPPGMSMRMGGGPGPLGPNRMMCPQPNDGGPPAGPPMMPKGGGMPPGAYPMMAAGAAQRMMRPSAPMQTAYNGANIQVKPNAPNTIQYLPNRPQTAAGMGARGGQPNLEFLRFQNAGNPMAAGGMEAKMQPPPPHAMNSYFANNYGGGPPGAGPINEMMAANMNCGMPPGANPMARPPSMRGAGGPPPPNMGRMGGGMPGAQMGMPPFNEQMYPPQGGGGGGPGGGPPNMPNNCHMFMGGGPGGQGPPKMGALGMGGGNVTPDATQPLPPSMAQPGNFKNAAAFMNAALPDMDNQHYQANYQQFQQQLYATNTRSQVGGGQPMSAPNDQYYGGPK